MIDSALLFQSRFFYIAGRISYNSTHLASFGSYWVPETPLMWVGLARTDVVIVFWWHT
jgi:hypothetical protein